MENALDWQSLQCKYSDRMELFKEQYPSKRKVLVRCLKFASSHLSLDLSLWRRFKKYPVSVVYTNSLNPSDPKESTPGRGFKKMRFLREDSLAARVDWMSFRIKKRDAVSKISIFVWTGPWCCHVLVRWFFFLLVEVVLVSPISKALCLRL